MKKIGDISQLFFVGIGGIGMSALARYFHSLGKSVAGYDKTATEITEALETLGISILYDESVEVLPKPYLDKENTLVVFTPAIPLHHKQLQYFNQNDFTVLKRAEVLGLLTEDVYTLAVAGTHGKTTTSTILAHLLYASGTKVTAFLGGISENYKSNYLSSGNDVIVVEADEFDRSFLQLSPNCAAITSMDADHLDIYGNNAELQASFNAFAALNTGELFVTEGLPLIGKTIGIGGNSDYTAQNIRVANGTYIFDLKTPKQTFKELRLNLPGHHNLRNAITAFAMALQLGTPAPELAKALFSFKGIERRFSYQIKTNDFVFIDDYAHHPTEINALHQAVREMHPNKKILAIFQPHLYSRTRDFALEFGKSLAQFDEVVLLDIYPARELPIAGVSSSWLLELIPNKNKSILAKKQLAQYVQNNDAQIILTIGAGDIGAEVTPLKEALLV